MEIEKVVSTLSEQGRFEDMFILARYFYAAGEYFIPDATYDTMVEVAREHGILTEYLNRNADEDPMPVSLLEEFGLNINTDDVADRTDYFNRLTEEQSFSIKPLFEYEPVWEFVTYNRGQDLVLSLKVDGIFCKSLIDDGEWKASASRGRHGRTCFDYTYAVQQVVPNRYDDKGTFIVQSELFVEESWLGYLREKYPQKQFVGPRFAGTSLARVHYEPQDYEGFRCMVHGFEGYGSKLSEQYEKAKELGLNVVPYEVIKAEDVPTDKYDFIIWLRNKLDWYYETYQHIPSDGMVLSIDNLTGGYNVNGTYTDHNIALKLEAWNNKYYSGTVTSIMIEQKRVVASCRVTIVPTVLKDGTEARIINVFNPSLLIEAGLKVGSRVYYERTSNAINVLSRKGMVSIEGADEVG